MEGRCGGGCGGGEDLVMDREEEKAEEEDEAKEFMMVYNEDMVERQNEVEDVVVDREED